MQQPEHDLRPFQASVASPRRYVSIALVALLHVIVIWALATGLAARLGANIKHELKVAVVQEKPPAQEKPPPPPPPDMAKPPPPFVPPPMINIQSEAPATNAITNVQSRRPAPVAIVPPRPAGRRHDCYSGYPPISKRLNEQGRVLVQFTVGADGSVSSVKVDKSSGYSRLDNAAVSCVSSWHYHPATQGGRPIAVTTKALVDYELR